MCECICVQHSGRLSRFSDVKNIIISFKHVYYMDIDGMDALGQSIEELERDNKRIVLCDCQFNTNALAIL